VKKRPKKDDDVAASLTEIDGPPEKDDDVVASLAEIDGLPEKRIRIKRILYSQVDEDQSHRGYSKERMGAAQVAAGGIGESSTKSRQKPDGLQPASKKPLSKFPHSKQGPLAKFVSAQESAREQLLGAAQPQSMVAAVTPSLGAAQLQSMVVAVTPSLGAAQPQSMVVAVTPSLGAAQPQSMVVALTPSLGAAQPQSAAVAVTPRVRHGRKSGGQTKCKRAQWTAGKQRVRHTFGKSGGTMAVVGPNLEAAGTAHQVQVIDQEQQKQVMEEEMGQKQVMNEEKGQEVTEEMRQIATTFSLNSTKSIPLNFFQVCMLVHTYAAVCMCVHICVNLCGEG